MTTAHNADLPLHLAGNNAPVTEEVTAEPAEVIGAIPEELNGVYLGRTPLYAHPRQSRFALAFDRATGHVDYRVTTANTHLVAHAGRLLALEEGGFPYEITPELQTVGPFTFDGALHTPMTAHPEVCPRTGELLFFGVRLRPPYLTYYRAAPTGPYPTLGWWFKVQVAQSPRASCSRMPASAAIRIDSVCGESPYSPRSLAAASARYFSARPW